MQVKGSYSGIDELHCDEPKENGKASPFPSSYFQKNS